MWTASLGLLPPQQMCVLLQCHSQMPNLRAFVWVCHSWSWHCVWRYVSRNEAHLEQPTEYGFPKKPEKEGPSGVHIPGAPAHTHTDGSNSARQRIDATPKKNICLTTTTAVEMSPTFQRETGCGPYHVVGHPTLQAGLSSFHIAVRQGLSNQMQIIRFLRSKAA